MNIESGYYYVLDRLRPGKVRIIEVDGNRIYDGRQFFTDFDLYEFLGPVASLSEMESLVNATAEPFNPCAEQTP